MGFVPSNTIKVGDKVRCLRDFVACCGKFEKGSIVTIIEDGPRGYGISDGEGHQIIECGWDGFEKV